MKSETFRLTLVVPEDLRAVLIDIIEAKGASQWIAFVTLRSQRLEEWVSKLRGGHAIPPAPPVAVRRAVFTTWSRLREIVDGPAHTRAPRSGPADGPAARDLAPDDTPRPFEIACSVEASHIRVGGPAFKDAYGGTDAAGRSFLVVPIALSAAKLDEIREYVHELPDEFDEVLDAEVPDIDGNLRGLTEAFESECSRSGTDKGFETGFEVDCKAIDWGSLPTFERVGGRPWNDGLAELANHPRARDAAEKIRAACWMRGELRANCRESAFGAQLLAIDERVQPDSVRVEPPKQTLPAQRPSDHWLDPPQHAFVAWYRWKAQMPLDEMLEPKTAARAVKPPPADPWDYFRWRWRGGVSTDPVENGRPLLAVIEGVSKPIRKEFDATEIERFVAAARDDFGWAVANGRVVGEDGVGICEAAAKQLFTSDEEFGPVTLKSSAAREFQAIRALAVALIQKVARSYATGATLKSKYGGGPVSPPIVFDAETLPAFRDTFWNKVRDFWESHA